MKKENSEKRGSVTLTTTTIITMGDVVTEIGITMVGLVIMIETTTTIATIQEVMVVEAQAHDKVMIIIMKAVTAQGVTDLLVIMVIAVRLKSKYGSKKSSKRSDRRSGRDGHRDDRDYRKSSRGKGSSRRDEKKEQEEPERYLPRMRDDDGISENGSEGKREFNQSEYYVPPIPSFKDFHSPGTGRSKKDSFAPLGFSRFGVEINIGGIFPRLLVCFIRYISTSLRGVKCKVLALLEH